MARKKVVAKTKAHKSVVLDAEVISSSSKSKSAKKTKSRRPKAALPDIFEQAEKNSGSALVSSDPLVSYLNEIRKYALLTKEEEHELALKYHKTKDPLAAEKLVTSNLRFVVKV